MFGKLGKRPASVNPDIYPVEEVSVEAPVEASEEALGSMVKIVGVINGDNVDISFSGSGSIETEDDVLSFLYLVAVQYGYEFVRDYSLPVESDTSGDGEETYVTYITAITIPGSENLEVSFENEDGEEAPDQGMLLVELAANDLGWKMVTEDEVDYEEDELFFNQ